MPVKLQLHLYLVLGSSLVDSGFSAETSRYLSRKYPFPHQACRVGVKQSIFHALSDVPRPPSPMLGAKASASAVSRGTKGHLRVVVVVVVLPVVSQAVSVREHFSFLQVVVVVHSLLQNDTKLI